MSECWSIDHPSPLLRVVRLTPAATDDEPVVVAEELTLAVANSLPTDAPNVTVELDFSDWSSVDSRLFALLLYFHRRCRERGYKMVVSSPPRLLSQMTGRLGVAKELGIGVSRSRDYSQLFRVESRAS
jgi:ABC-type transporter Mla MlaB component